MNRRIWCQWKSLKLDKCILNWQTQRVCINNQFTIWASVTSGIQQGSVLGPVRNVHMLHKTLAMIRSSCVNLDELVFKELYTSFFRQLKKQSCNSTLDNLSKLLHKQSCRSISMPWRAFHHSLDLIKCIYYKTSFNLSEDKQIGLQPTIAVQEKVN